METFEDRGLRMANCRSAARLTPRNGQPGSTPYRVFGRAARVSESSIRNSQSGYTLAAVLVILSIVAIITAYLVPKMWSDIMWRERDLQTIFVMKQYARAINDYQRVRGGLPTSLEQLEKQTLPRVLRQTWNNPLSGELDWILVPQGTATPGQQPAQGAGGAPPGQQSNQPPGTGQPARGQGPGTPTNQLGQPGGGDPRNYSGPFIGVRPPQTGASFLELNGQKSYENWIYTVNELLADQARRGTAPPAGQQGQRPN